MADFDFAGVARAALGQALSLLPQWLPGGKLIGREYMVGDLSGASGDSLRINVQSGKWSDFASDAKGGDLIALYAAVYSVPQIEAALELGVALGVIDRAELEDYRRRHGAETPRRRSAATPKAPAVPHPKADIWSPETPVPDDAPPRPEAHWKYGPAGHVARYVDAESRLLNLIHRFEPSQTDTGRKEIVPQTFGTLTKHGKPSRRGWHWRGLPAPRPLYGLDLLAAAPGLPVLVVEGEKKAEAARRMLGARCVVLSWPGGGKAVDHADWSPLAGRAVWVWPDNDKPGLLSAAAVARIVLTAGAASAETLPPPDGVADKWDLADAEAEGWTGERVWQHITAPRHENAGGPKSQSAEAPTRQGASAFDLRDPSAPLYSPSIMAPPPTEETSAKPPPQTKARRRAEVAAGEAAAEVAADRARRDEAHSIPWPEEVARLLWCDADAPVRPVGHSQGRCFMFDHAGQLRDLAASDLVKRPVLVELCGSREWLLEHYERSRKRADSSLSIEEAGEDLMFACQSLGLYSAVENPQRRPGIWADEAGRPLLHLGDVLRLADGQMIDAGCMYGGAVYPRTARQRRPAEPAKAEAARELLAGLESLWTWKEGPSAARLLLGWMASALYGAAASWRANVFLCGPAGTGKSKAVAVVRAGLLLHAYSNDSTKAGVEGRVSNRPGPIILDEAAEADRGERAAALVSMLRGMTQGDGAQGQRGTPDGVGRSFSVLGSVMFAATMAPPMEAQDMHRVTLLELAKPPAGSADNSAAMDALAARAQVLAPALFGRVLEGFDRWRACLAIYRKALVAAGCAARQADQLGPQLAGWHVLCFDDVPDAEFAVGAVQDVRRYVVTSDEAEQDDAPARALSHLLTSRIASDKAGDRRQVGELLLQAYGAESPDYARAWLRGAGIDVSYAESARGIYVARRHSDLEGLFSGTSFRGYTWAGQLARLPGAYFLKGVNRRIGGYSGRVLFVPAVALDLLGAAPGIPPAPPAVDDYDDIP